MADVWVTVQKVSGSCPVHSEGDRFVLHEGFALDSLGGSVCLHALLGMAALLWALGHGHSPEELSLGDPPLLACPDPGPPLSCGGRVLFRLEVSE